MSDDVQAKPEVSRDELKRQLQAEEQAELRDRADACLKELAEILNRHNCNVEMRVVLGALSLDTTYVQSDAKQLVVVPLLPKTDQEG